MWVAAFFRETKKLDGLVNSIDVIAQNTVKRLRIEGTIATVDP